MGVIGLNYVSFEQMKQLSTIHDTLKSFKYLEKHGDIIRPDSEIFYLLRYDGSKSEEGKVAAFMILNGNTFEGAWSYDGDRVYIHELIYRWVRPNDTVILSSSMFDHYHGEPHDFLKDLSMFGSWKDGDYVYSRCKDRTEHDIQTEGKYEN